MKLFSNLNLHLVCASIVFFTLNLNGQNAFYDALHYQKNKTNIESGLERLAPIFNSDEFISQLQLLYDGVDSVRMAHSDISPAAFNEVLNSIDQSINALKTIDPVFLQGLEDLSLFINDPFEDLKGEVLSWPEALSLLKHGDDFLIQSKVDEYLNTSVEELVMPLLQPTDFSNIESNPVTSMPKEYVPTPTRVAVPGSVSFPSMLVEGTADFLVERVKDELMLAFFEDFLLELEQDSFQVLMPNTYLMLKNQEFFNMPSLGRTWKAAFEMDMQEMIPNFTRFAQVQGWDSNPQTADVLQIMLTSDQILQLVKAGAHPGDMLSVLDQRHGDSLNNISSAIRFANILSQNLISDGSNGDSYWVSNTELKELKEFGILYFSAFLYQRNKDYFHSTQLGGQSLASLMKDNYRDVYYHANNLILHFKNLQALSEQFHDPLILEQKSRKQAAVISYINGIFDLLDAGFQAYSFTESNYYESDYYNHYKGLFGSFILSADAVLNKKYEDALLYTLAAMDGILALVPAKSPEAVTIRKISKNLAFYGSFMVDVIYAEDSRDVKAALDNYALPVGSYRLKEKAKRSLTLNAFPGIALASETALGNGISEDGWAVSVTAPIGLAYSWNKMSENNRNSIFVSILDIGAAFSYRWGASADDMADDKFPQNLEWSHILAPGVHYVRGISGTPVSLAAGVQYVPRLRSIANGNADVSNFDALRVGVSVVVDIPVFNFYYKK